MTVTPTPEFAQRVMWPALFELAQSLPNAHHDARPLTPLEAHVYAGAESFGAHVLDAADVSDLRARIYAIARSEQFVRWSFACLPLFEGEEIPSAADAERTYAGALGPHPLAKECARLLAARVAAVAQVPAVMARANELRDPVQILIALRGDFRAPALLRSLMTETATGDVALIALITPFVDPGRWPGGAWLRLALLEQLRLACVSHLRLLSLIPDISIPEDSLPLDERLDPAALELEAHEQARHLLPATLEVGADYVARLRDLIDGDAPAPDGVRAIFAD
jgi:hypothetical protein